ncbi:MAG: carbohydrate-binding domain-containing protein, partial [Clostridia bacterium]|nr:carbohydrate-binding domain-containing protein [Clostridia bacterium]
MKKIKIFIPVTAILLSFMMILSACGSNNTSGTKNKTSVTSGSTATLDTTDMFTERDYATDYDESTATKITISESNPNISITKAGTYIITGIVSDGSVTVDVPDTDKVQVVLNSVSITSKTSAALYVKSADKVFVTTVKGTENTLANGGTFKTTDDNNIDGAVFSKSDITFNGEGTLTVKSPAGHSVVGKDDVKLTGGTYNFTCLLHGIDANDSIRIANATINITSGEDGLHSENNDDNEKGYIYIESGTITIKSGDDGIHAITYLTIDGGTLNITAAEGLEATHIQINDGTINIEASDDGINAAKKSTVTTLTVEINGGKIT